MSQLYFGQCLNEFAPIPDLLPRFSGAVGARQLGVCRGGDEKPRRKEVPKQSYGGGIPCNHGLRFTAQGWPVEVKAPTYETIPTAAGPVKLAVSPLERGYMPTLDFLTQYQDSRLQPPPGRYFSR